jgi:hypothetical protein
MKSMRTSFFSPGTLLPLLLWLGVVFALVGCEDVINLKVETGPQQLVVDGWLTNQPGPQQVRLTLSDGYFSNRVPQPALGAEVTVTDNLGKIFQFKDPQNKGLYEWVPAPGDTLGRVGSTYTLRVKYQGEQYFATTAIRPVPVIDSLVYQAEKLPFRPPNGPREGFFAEFFARDFVGVGDCYWIKALKGGVLYADDPENITLAFDAAFSPGSVSDGSVFILPLRRSININQLSSAGDTLGVELHSITQEAYFFLQQVRQESGNGGIFAVPPSNIISNIRNVKPGGAPALGYFGASAISRAETIIDPANAKPKE